MFVFRTLNFTPVYRLDKKTLRFFYLNLNAIAKIYPLRGYILTSTTKCLFSREQATAFVCDRTLNFILLYRLNKKNSRRVFYLN